MAQLLDGKLTTAIKTTLDILLGNTLAITDEEISLEISMDDPEHANNVLGYIAGVIAISEDRHPHTYRSLRKYINPRLELAIYNKIIEFSQVKPTKETWEAYLEIILKLITIYWHLTFDNFAIWEIYYTAQSQNTKRAIEYAVREIKGMDVSLWQGEILSNRLFDDSKEFIDSILDYEEGNFFEAILGIVRRNSHLLHQTILHILKYGLREQPANSYLFEGLEPFLISVLADILDELAINSNHLAENPDDLELLNLTIKHQGRVFEISRMVNDGVFSQIKPIVEGYEVENLRQVAATLRTIREYKFEHAILTSSISRRKRGSTILDEILYGKV